MIEIINSFNGKLKLNLCGEFSSKTLLNKAKNHPAWKWVIYHGLIPHDKVFSNFQFIYRLINFDNRKTFEESYPIKLFEYISMGIPIYASDFKYWREKLINIIVFIFVIPKIK